MKNKFQHSFYLLKELSGLKVRNCLVFFINWYLIILNSAKKIKNTEGLFVPLEFPADRASQHK